MRRLEVSIDCGKALCTRCQFLLGDSTKGYGCAIWRHRGMTWPAERCKECLEAETEPRKGENDEG
jgi:hypothetical protein